MNAASSLSPVDLVLLRRSIAVAKSAREHGNHPFGAVLGDSAGNILVEAENTVVTGCDCTGHAETNLMRLVSAKVKPERLAGCTFFASTEPCPMCSGAMFWGGIRRVVYGLGQAGLYGLTGDSPHKLPLSCRDVLSHGARATEVIGPALEDEARVVHVGFW